MRLHMPNIPMSSSLRGAAGAALLIGACLLSACGGGKPEDGAATPAAAEASGPDGAGKTETRVPVETGAVSRRPIAASYSGTAALQARAEAQVVSKASGVLFKLLAEEGDMVKAGQVLAQLDPERPRLEVQRAEATLRKLESEYRRSSELFERKLIAADAHERIRFDLATQRAAYDLAKLELSYTTITAPIDGVIAERMVKAGNLIQINAAMFRIVDTRQLEAVLNVPERELATMRPDLPVSLQVDALPGQRFVGRIDRVSPVVDAGSGTFRVTAAFDGGALKAGMFGRIEVVYDSRADVLTVPRAALIEGDGETAVFLVRDGRAVRTAIRTGYVNGSFAEVRDGLAEGDRVVTVGKVTLRDGAAVDVLDAATAVEAADEDASATEATAARP